MKLRNLIPLMALLSLLLPLTVQADTPEYLALRPLSEVAQGRLGNVQSGPYKLPMITWGGDISTVASDVEGIFKSEGANVRIELREDNFQKQVEACLRGETPYLRGTLGMINAASEVFERAGTKLVPIYQLTWSNGGDAMVVRPGINKPEDLRGKTIAVQLYGPHMDYVANLLASAGLKMSDVKFKWMRELYLPDYDTRGKLVDPVSAFAADPSIDAVMCIIPDALALTSNGTVGTGAEGSVKGAKILLSTKTANRIIADVYAVRADYLSSHKSEVQKVVRALFKGEEALKGIRDNQSSNTLKYKAIIDKSAELVFGVPGATADTEALLGDCEFVGYAGNVAFFTGQGTTRNLDTLNKEIQTAFINAGLMSGRVTIPNPGWDYAALATGLRYATNVPKARPKFDNKKAHAAVERRIEAEASTWESEGTLFTVEIYFEPNQDVFTVSQYEADFAEALKKIETYGGALRTIEGHTNIYGVQKAEQDGKSQTEINEMIQVGKDTSLRRARAVRDAFIDYCQTQGVAFERDEFVAVGMGIRSPKFPVMKTKEQWAQNRRVVFRIKQVEAEAEEFVPLGN